MAPTRDESGPGKVKNVKATTGNRVLKPSARPRMRWREESRHPMCHPTPIVRIYVGPGKRKFEFHEAVLFEHSPYFQALFGMEGRYFFEGITKVAYPEEEDPSVFKYIVEWMYSHQIKETHFKADDKGEKLNIPSPIMWTDIWKLADCVGMIPLCDHAVGRLWNLHGPYPDLKNPIDLTCLTRRCYERTLPDISLRLWISDAFALGVAD